MNIPQEQPPVNDPVLLTEWLTRMIILINGALSASQNYEPTGSIPERQFNGMVKYFDREILPDITHAGIWAIVEGVWKPLTPP